MTSTRYNPVLLRGSKQRGLGEKCLHDDESATVPQVPSTRFDCWADLAFMSRSSRWQALLLGFGLTAAATIGTRG